MKTFTKKSMRLLAIISSILSYFKKEVTLGEKNNPTYFFLYNDDNDWL